MQARASQEVPSPSYDDLCFLKANNREKRSEVQERKTPIRFV
jgi:hypothetical protein